MARSSLRVRSAEAVADDRLGGALAAASDRFSLGRGLAQMGVNWDELRDAARSIRAEIMGELHDVLGTLADNVEARGGHVHWAADAAEATQMVADIASRRGATRAVKSKSMVSEEIHLNDALAERGVDVVETDLGEWIIQLAGETPSHIIAPALHRTRGDVRDLFNRVAGGDVSDVPADLCAFARGKLREAFLAADLGITGVNFGVAETGTVCLVTNEGNGRMVTSLPRTHVAVMGMERVVRTWSELDIMLALLTRAASGQPVSVYVSCTTEPRRRGEPDGPEEFHLVILDNGRSQILGTEFQEVLHCIRCGACLNVCPVYRQIGGHAYGAVYPGPIGAVLTPLLEPEKRELAQASSLCAACHEVCPVRIPLQDMLLAHRRRDGSGLAWKAWAAAWSSPAAYRASTRLASTAMKMLPFAPRAWTSGRERPPAPEGPSFRRRFERGEI